MVKSKRSTKPSTSPKSTPSQSSTPIPKSSFSKALSYLSSNTSLLKTSINILEIYLKSLESPQTLIVSSQICSICAYNFNNQDRLPICLPCGHSICKFCVYTLQHTSLTGICPYDRKEYFFIQELLPTNFCLLNSENLQESRICKIHGFEIVGYCKDHEVLMCGKCIFGHIGDSFVEIEDEGVKEIAEKRVFHFEILERKVKGILDEWSFYFEQMGLVLQRCRMLPDKWGRQSLRIIKVLEKELFGQAPNQTCIKSFLDSLSICLERVKKLKTIFECFDVYEQLALIFKDDLEFPLPILSEIQEIFNKLEN